MLVNLLYTENSDLNREISEKEFSSESDKITIQSLILFGKYDFVFPPKPGLDFYTPISSTCKKIVVSPVNGYNLMFQDVALFSREVTEFNVEEFR